MSSNFICLWPYRNILTRSVILSPMIKIPTNQLMEERPIEAKSSIK